MKTINTTRKLCIVALFTAINIALSSFGVPVPGGHMYLNDVIICTAALLLDPFSAFFVGGVGAFFGDLLFYPTPMFVSLVTHGLQAAVISLIAVKKNRPLRFPSSLLAVFIGALIMIIGYSLGRAYIYSTPAYAVTKLPYQILQAFFGAGVSLILCFKTPVGKLKENI